LAAGERVVTYGTNSDGYVIAFLAIVRAGRVHVPVHYALHGAELAYLIAQPGSRAALADPHLRQHFEAVRAHTPVETVDVLRDEDGSFLERAVVGDAVEVPADVDGESLAQLLYTSGTTSQPKGAMLTHAALVAEYSAVLVALDQKPDDAPLICMPLYHSAAMHVFMLPYLAIGATIRLLPAPDISRILRT